MNQRYILFRRAGVFYYEDTSTGRQLSLRTKNQEAAKILLNAKNESFRQLMLLLFHDASSFIVRSIHDAHTRADSAVGTRRRRHGRRRSRSVTATTHTDRNEA